MSRTRHLKPLAVALMGSLLLSACYPIQTAQSTADRTEIYGASLDGKTIKEGGTLVMGLSAEPDKLDPTTSSSLYTRYVMDSICEKLYDIDSAGKIIPLLATALPTISSDGKTMSIPIKEGVKFADGTPLNAEAVKTTFDRNLTMPTSARKGELGTLKSVSVTGPYQVTLHLTGPYAPMTAALADRAGMIMSPAALKKLGDNFGNAPVCVGPMKFVKRIPQTEIDVVKDPNYYDAKDVHLDSVQYRIMTDSNIRAANLRSGDIQVADTISTQDIDALNKEKGIQVMQSGSLGYQGITFNLGNTKGVGKPPGRIDTPLAQDPRVRHAFELSIDRQALVNSVFNNWQDPMCTPFPPKSIAAGDPADCTKFDPKQSLALLKQAGVKVPYKINMKVSNSPDALRFAAALQASVKAGGFQISIVPVEYSTLLDDQSKGNFEMLQLGWSGRIDPDGNLSRFVKTGASNNYAGYSSPKVDQLLAEGAAETDPAKRPAIYREIVDVIHQDMPLVYLYNQRNLTATTTNVAGVYVYTDGIIRVAKAAYVSGGSR